MREGDDGEAVADVQRRLTALGFAIGADQSGHFGAATVGAVRAFQERRGLRTDGVCGDHTWHALVEAGYRLGDRPLYLMHPLLRGDDVSALQSRLGALGFDAGRVDGIFGARTDRALADFQRNAGLVTDSICGPATIAALARLGMSCDAPYSSASVRERERVRRGPATLAGRLIAIGEGGGVGGLAEALRVSVTAAGGRTVVVQTEDGSAQAEAANEAEADAFVGLVLDVSAEPDDKPVCSTAYYRSPHGWQSLEGLRLAVLVQEALTIRLAAVDSGVRGMSIPLLRETRMPAVMAELGPAATVAAQVGGLADGLSAALRQWIIESG